MPVVGKMLKVSIKLVSSHLEENLFQGVLGVLHQKLLSCSAYLSEFTKKCEEGTYFFFF